MYVYVFPFVSRLSATTRRWTNGGGAGRIARPDAAARHSPHPIACRRCCFRLHEARSAPSRRRISSAAARMLATQILVPLNGALAWRTSINGARRRGRPLLCCGGCRDRGGTVWPGRDARRDPRCVADRAHAVATARVALVVLLRPARDGHPRELPRATARGRHRCAAGVHARQPPPARYRGGALASDHEQRGDVGGGHRSERGRVP